VTWIYVLIAVTANLIDVTVMISTNFEVLATMGSCILMLPTTLYLGHGHEYDNVTSCFQYVYEFCDNLKQLQLIPQ